MISIETEFISEVFLPSVDFHFGRPGTFPANKNAESLYARGYPLAEKRIAGKHPKRSLFFSNGYPYETCEMKWKSNVQYDIV